MGSLVWGKRSKTDYIIVEDAWPATIDKETFEKVQSLLKCRAPKIIHPRRTASDYLLSGIIKCGVCGRAMSGHSAKSGHFFYYRCAKAMKGGAEECPSHWIPKFRIENFVIEKIRSYILIEDNLLELLHLTNEEISSGTQREKEQVKVLERQIRDIESRLEHLYDALETSAFNHEELAPRIRKQQARLEELREVKLQAELELQAAIFDLPDINRIQDYVNDLGSLLVSSPILEQRAFLKSFVKEIRVDADKMTVHYTLPMPPEKRNEEVLGVLPFAQHGRPYRSRTHWA